MDLQPQRPQNASDPINDNGPDHVPWPPTPANRPGVDFGVPQPAQPQQPQFQEPPQAPQSPQQNQAWNPQQQPGVPAGYGQQPAATPAYGGAAGMPAQRRKNRKPLIIGLVAFVLLAGAGAAYALLVYIPNKPENVWATGLNRSSQALDTLITSASSQETRKAYEKMKLAGSVSVSSGTTKASGTVSGTFNDKAADGSMTLNYSDGSTATSSASTQQIKLGLDLRSLLPDGAQYPDSYFRLTGFKSLGLDGFLPGVSQYDGKWIEITGKYIQDNLPMTDDKTATGTDQQLTGDDVTALLKTEADITKQYVLTDDPSKAVIVRKQFVGKETSEGMQAYHYKAGINDDHAKAYCEAVSNAFVDSVAYKKFVTDSQAQADAKKDAQKECASTAAESAKDDDSFDLWMTADTKILQKIRVDDPDEAGTYMEIGQTYAGGDSIPQFFRLHSDKDKMDVEQQASYDMKTHDISFNVNGKGQKTDDRDAFDVTVRLSLAPFNGDVPTDKPANSQPLPDVLKKLGVDPDALASEATGGLSDV